MIWNSVLPVFAVIGVGWFLKRMGWVGEGFLVTSDRLVYYLFFPVLLFWKIGEPARGVGIRVQWVLGVLFVIAVAWGFSLLWSRWIRLSRFETGAFSQCCYRFNTYMGMAVILGFLGDEGVRVFGVIIGFAIPFINVLAVSTLIWMSRRGLPLGKKAAVTLRAAASNPFILACGAGLLYARLGIPFPPLVRNTFRLLSAAALPLALLSIGGSLSLATLSGRLKPALAASLLKVGFLPLFGCGLLRALGVEGLVLQTAVVFFALPTSTSSYVLSAQLDSDPHLASAAIVLSTLLSLASLSLAIGVLAP